MPLFSLLVEDGNGTGQTVGYAFITHETEHTLSAIMTEISRIHKLEKVKVVVLDKDMKEGNRSCQKSYSRGRSSTL